MAGALIVTFVRLGSRLPGVLRHLETVLFFLRVLTFPTFLRGPVTVTGDREPERSNESHEVSSHRNIQIAESSFNVNATNFLQYFGSLAIIVGANTKQQQNVMIPVHHHSSL
jgi:hypothetical protein